MLQMQFWMVLMLLCCPGETSVGRFAVDAVKMMSKIAMTTENSCFYQFDTDTEPNDDEITFNASGGCIWG